MSFQARPLDLGEYRILVEQSPILIWRSGTDMRCDYFNERWLDYTGRSMAQELGHGWAEGVHPDDFEALLVPGGYSPDKLRRDEAVKRFTRAIHEAGKCVASICHGPWIDISAGIVKGATYTSTPGLTDDLRNAGATWVDRPVVIDANHVTSRRPDDLPEFCKGILEVMSR